MPDEKMIRYRAAKLVEKRGLVYDAALALAREQAVHERESNRQAEKRGQAARSRASMKRHRKPKRFKVTHTVSGRAVSCIYSGGAPGSGKRG